MPLTATGWALLVAALLDVGALATIWVGRRHSTKSKTLWTILVLALPVLGALGWFLLGQERRGR